MYFFYKVITLHKFNGTHVYVQNEGVVVQRKDMYVRRGEKKKKKIIATVSYYKQLNIP